MKVLCVGKKAGSFVNQQGEYLEYSKIHCVYDVPQVSDGNNVSCGREVDSFSVPRDIFDAIPDEECQLNVEFNQKGKVVGVDIV